MFVELVQVEIAEFVVADGWEKDVIDSHQDLMEAIAFQRCLWHRLTRLLEAAS